MTFFPPIRPLAAAALALLGVLAPARAADPATQPAPRPAGLSAEVLGVRITRDVPDGLRANNLVRSFDPNGQNGPTVQVLLVVRAADGKIVEADPQKVRIDTFLDDTYRDLRPAPDANQRRQYYGGQSGNLSEDGAAAAFVLSTDRAPAAGAERLLIRGAIALKTSRAEKKSEKLPLTLRIGESITFGKATLTVGSLTLTGGVMGTQVQLRSDQPLEAISDLFVFDADGKPLMIPPGAQQSIQQSVRTGGGRNGGGPSFISFPLPQNLEKVQVQFSYAESVVERDVPFEVQVDLGTAKVGGKEEGKPGPAKPQRSPALEDAADPNADLPRPGARGPTPARSQFVRTVAERVRPFGPDRARPDWPADPNRAVNFPPRREPAWPADSARGSGAATRPAFAPRTPFPEAAPPQALPPEASNSEVTVLAVATAPAPEGADEQSKDISAVDAIVTSAVSSTGWPINPAALFKPNGGTQVQLLVKVPGERLAAVDAAALRIDAFDDDAGTALSVEQFAPPTGLEQFYPRPSGYPGRLDRPDATDVVIRGDGSAALFRVAMEATPTPGATRIRLRGRVPVQFAGEPRQVKGTAAPLRPGVDLAPADGGFRAPIVMIRAYTPPAVTPTVTAAAAALHPNGVSIRDVLMELTVRSDLPPERVSVLRLVDASGESVCNAAPRLSGFSPGVPSDPASRGYVYNFTVPAVAGPVTPEWTLLGPARRATVPFDITTGLGP